MMMMTVGFGRLATVGALSLTTLGLGCGTKLATATEKVDLAKAGLAVTVDAPRGGQVEKDGTQGVRIAWGEHGEAGSLALRLREMELKCTEQDENCKVVEQTGSRILKEMTFMKKAMLEGLANVPAGGTTLGCRVTAKDVAEVRRLLTACESATAAAPLATMTSLTSASASATEAAAAPPSLTEVTSTDKDATGPFAFSIRVPEGHVVLESGVSRTYGSPKGTRIWDQVSVSVSPYLKVTSLANAEKEARTLDLGGLDVIAERRELSKTSFLLATAPRGTGRTMTVSVYASGKKRGALAKCFGKEAFRKTLEEMCTSLKLVD